ncbi:hypothetical protein F1559_003813 [Cyanidiococcus yangmingshanensis]|uniref:BRK domain-containing protein n=1 Tax=Cyanidiococcus yangmingshanensis TaxID=2690220 RepID=A0A7J7IN32_9RHOD|nr:hypothetical protein F1559_003813 [Cyanidiococcus yangmingshanensis]
MVQGNAAEVARAPFPPNALSVPAAHDEEAVGTAGNVHENRVNSGGVSDQRGLQSTLTGSQSSLPAGYLEEVTTHGAHAHPGSAHAVPTAQRGVYFGAHPMIGGHYADSNISSVPRSGVPHAHHGGPVMSAPEWAPCARSWTAGLMPSTSSAFYAYQQRSPGMFASGIDCRFVPRNMNRASSPGRSHAIPIHGARHAGHHPGPAKQGNIELGCLTDFYDRNRIAIQLTGKLVTSGQLESLLEQAPEDEHVTVWHPATGRTVAGNAAPYRRNLETWLDKNPGWVEKSFEEKSSKRRRATRRSRAAMSAFSSLCTGDDRIRDILKEVDQAVRHAVRERKNAGLFEEAILPGDAGPSVLAASYQDPISTSIMNHVLKEWTSDEIVRLIESMVRCSDEIAQSGAGLDSDDESFDLAELAERGSTEANDHDSYLSYRKARLPNLSTIDAALHTRVAQRDTASGGLMVPMDMDDLQHSSPPMRNEAEHAERAISGETFPAWRKIFEALSSKRPSSVVLRAHALFAQVLLAAAQRGTLTNPVQSPSPTSSASLGMTNLDHLNRTLSSSHDSASGVDHVAGFAALGLYGRSPSASPAEGASRSAPADGQTLPRNVFRDARITVWDPSTGKTISGNAAPCWRNLEIWMKEHPGWCVKHEDELSASRRSKHRRARELGMSTRISPLRAPTCAMELASTVTRVSYDRRAMNTATAAVGRAESSFAARSLPDEHDCIEGLLMMHSGRPLEPMRADSSELRPALNGRPPLPPQSSPLSLGPNQAPASAKLHDGMEAL